MITVSVALLLSACSSAGAPAENSLPSGAVPVDPVFREFYNSLGGRDVLGYAIAPATRDSMICQYTAAALMCYDPNAADAERFSLQPLGARVIADRDQPGTYIGGSGLEVDGFLINEAFVNQYKRMNGARYVGRPLINARRNPGLNRIEQFFENVGFYYLLDDPDHRVRLIAYGAVDCRERCNYQPQGESTVIGGQAPVSEPFLPVILRLNGASAFGRPLTGAYYTPDGSLEQVYERIVLFADPNNPASARLRPTAIILGKAFTLPVERRDDPRLVFYPVQGNLGYNVPVVFDHFIAMHGGKEISGPPISELFTVSSQNIFRQCFENYCLDYDPAQSQDLRVQIAALGQEYINLRGLGGQAVTPFQLTPETVILSVGELQPQIAADAEQKIVMMVVQRRDQHPIPNIEGELTLYLPDGSTYTAYFPPTGQNGLSEVTIPAQPQLANGTLLTYQVCVSGGNIEQVCVPESYLIWNNQ
ncbi:MAG TPA: hypothetical protein VIO36_05970 [Anaerolineaceae bacterium]